MTEVVSNLKPDPVDCPCGCGAVGQPNKRNGHPRSCVSAKCASCRNRRNRKGGLTKQNQARRALGVPPAGQHEERWSSMFGDECKAGAQVGPVANWWLRVEKQVHANEADHGDLRRPVRAIAMPTGWSDGLVVVRLSTWRTHIAPALDEFYGDGAA